MCMLSGQRRGVWSSASWNKEPAPWFQDPPDFPASHPPPSALPPQPALLGSGHARTQSSDRPFRTLPNTCSGAGSRQTLPHPISSGAFDVCLDDCRTFSPAGSSSGPRISDPLPVPALLEPASHSAPKEARPSASRARWPVRPHGSLKPQTLTVSCQGATPFAS